MGAASFPVDAKEILSLCSQQTPGEPEVLCESPDDHTWDSSRDFSLPRLSILPLERQRSLPQRPALALRSGGYLGRASATPPFITR